MPVIDVLRGTAEQTWAAHERLRTLPAFQWPDAARIVVIAPHPDDETLGIGGAMCLAAQRGLTVELVAVTRGEASHPHSAAITPERLAEMRVRERQRALAALGLSHARLTQLNVPDGAVPQASDLAAHLVPLIREADYCFAPLRSDGHPDHDATGQAAAQACALTGVRLCEYPVWAWHWAHPDHGDLPWARARRIDLSSAAQRAKAAAIEEYRSQIDPFSDDERDHVVLTQSVREHFAREFEVLFI